MYPHISAIFPILFFAVSLVHLAHSAENPTKIRLNVKTLPKVVEWIEDTEGRVQERSRKALMEGPDALEKLVQALLEKEMKDRDGKYVTPFFYREICDERDHIGGEPWEVYLGRTFKEWRERYPASGPAKIATARFHFLESERAKKRCIGVADVDQKWEVVMAKQESAMGFLKECREWNKRDPGWAVTFFVLVAEMGIDEEESEAVLDEAMGVFPDSSYIFSRGAFLKLPMSRAAKRLEMEPWMRERLGRLPPEEAAKLYVGTWAEMSMIRGMGPLMAFMTPDTEIMNRGFDLLAKQFPDSPSIACQEAFLSMNLLDDHQRAFKAIQRAKGRIDLYLLYRKDEYEKLLANMGSVSWKPEALGVSPIREYRYDIPVEFANRIEVAAKEGPRGLEELIRKLRAEEPLDRDGKYQSEYFFDWFDQGLNSSVEARIVQEKKKLVEEWMREIPDSPFAKLAAARWWINWAWDARSSYVASHVKDIQWRAFHQRLKIARQYLMACRELQETEPMWSSMIFTVQLGEGGDEEEFEEVAGVLFERFPDADAAVAAATTHFLPKWGGNPGSWEPWLKRHLKKLPEKQAAKAYARIMNSNAGVLMTNAGDRRQLFGDGAPDIELWLEGTELLKKELPDSTWVAAGEAILHSRFTQKWDLALEALKRMNGTLDYDVWGSPHNFNYCGRLVTWGMGRKK